MFFSHFPELMIVLVLALVVFGPKRLPELGASLGSGIKEFRKATSEIHQTMVSESAATTAAPAAERHDTADVTRPDARA